MVAVVITAFRTAFIPAGVAVMALACRLLLPVLSAMLVSSVVLAQTDGQVSGNERPPEAAADTVAENTETAVEGVGVERKKSWRDFFRSTRSQRRQLQEQGQYESLARETGDTAVSYTHLTLPTKA